MRITVAKALPPSSVIAGSQMPVNRLREVNDLTDFFSNLATALQRSGGDSALKYPALVVYPPSWDLLPLLASFEGVEVDTFDTDVPSGINAGQVTDLTVAAGMPSVRMQDTMQPGGSLDVDGKPGKAKPPYTMKKTVVAPDLKVPGEGVSTDPKESRFAKDATAYTDKLPEEQRARVARSYDALERLTV